jgi:hypothetical protein
MGGRTPGVGESYLNTYIAGYVALAAHFLRHCNCSCCCRCPSFLPSIDDPTRSTPMFAVEESFKCG